MDSRNSFANVGSNEDDSETLRAQQDPLQIKQLLKDRSRRSSRDLEKERLRDELRQIAAKSDDEFRKTKNLPKDGGTTNQGSQNQDKSKEPNTTQISKENKITLGPEELKAKKLKFLQELEKMELEKAVKEKSPELRPEEPSQPASKQPKDKVKIKQKIEEDKKKLKQQEEDARKLFVQLHHNIPDQGYEGLNDDEAKYKYYLCKSNFA